MHTSMLEILFLLYIIAGLSCYSEQWCFMKSKNEIRSREKWSSSISVSLCLIGLFVTSRVRIF